MSQLNVNQIVDSQGGVLAPISSVMRNRLINSDMRIDQRNAGASVTPTDGQYGVDRWKCVLTQTSKYSVQQNAGSVTPPAGFTNYLGVTSLSAYSIVATDYFALRQPIEGFNAADLAFGTANAATVTLSFWVRSSLTGTFGGAISNSAFNRTYVFSYTINSSNTWEQKSITIAGDTTGTWLTNNGAGLSLDLTLASGSNFTRSAGSWSTSGFAATGSVSVVGTNGATFFITGIQLEKGTQATSFEYRQYGQELALCQRYYWRNYGSSNGPFVDANQTTGGYVSVNYLFPCQMRATPTININGTFVLGNCTSLIATGTTISGFSIIAQATTTARTFFTGSNSTTFFDTSGAEL